MMFHLYDGKVLFWYSSLMPLMTTLCLPLSNATCIQTANTKINFFHCFTDSTSSLILSICSVIFCSHSSLGSRDCCLWNDLVGTNPYIYFCIFLVLYPPWKNKFGSICKTSFFSPLFHTSIFLINSYVTCIMNPHVKLTNIPSV